MFVIESRISDLFILLYALYPVSSRIQTNRRLTLRELTKGMSLTKSTKVSVIIAISLFMDAIILIWSLSIFSS